MNNYRFDCGCEVQIIDDKIKDSDNLPSLNIPYDDLFIDLNYGKGCPETWKLISDGFTKGVFQLETPLGRAWAEKLKPTNMEEIAALSSLLRPGCLKCLSAEVNITCKIETSNKQRIRYKKHTIKELYEMFNRKHNCYSYDIVSYDEINHSLIQNKIIKIIYSGKKEVFKPKFKTIINRDIKNKFYSLECSLDHPLLTLNRGWLPLSEIKNGERVAVIRGGQESNRKNIKHHKRQKSFRNLCFINYEYKCVMCDWHEASLDVNHMEGNRYLNNEVDNLCFLCPNHHRMYSEGLLSKEEILKNRQNLRLPNSDKTIWVEYVGYDYIGTKDTYDISVATPNNNFVAGNVIVHNCMIDGKSVPQHYVDRKHGIEKVEYPIPELEQFLDKTYGLMCFQEQTMRISQGLAGFTEQEADVLRKGIGKKKPEIIAGLRTPFLDGCSKVGLISSEEAKQIFDWIEKSNRYSFNASHSYSYGMGTYMSAWTKKHFPIHFYCAWLTYAKYKLKPYEQRRQLVGEAKRFDISVSAPNIFTMFDQSNDMCIHDHNLYFGIRCVKKVGEASLKKFLGKIKETETQIGRSIDKWSWFEFLTHVAVNCSSTVVNNLICCGVLKHWGITRQRMLYEYEIFKSLTDREMNTVVEYNSANLIGSLEHLISLERKSGGPATPGRKKKIEDTIKVLENPPHSLDDSPRWILTQEKELLGLPLTYCKIDTIPNNFAVNTTCKEFNDGKTGDDMSLAVEVISSREWEIKGNSKNSGKKMGFLTVEDATGEIDCVVFNDVWEENDYLLGEGSTLVIVGTKSNKGSFLIKKIFQI